jgi:hypothetical protein
LSVVTTTQALACLELVLALFVISWHGIVAVGRLRQRYSAVVQQLAEEGGHLGEVTIPSAQQTLHLAICIWFA